MNRRWRRRGRTRSTACCSTTTCPEPTASKSSTEMRALGDTVPVIALTGQGDEEVAVSLMKAGAVDYLNKNTLTAERLERSLRFALAMQRAEEERRELLEREQRARLEAQEANRAKDEFLATLSHELRTPLNAILGWSRLLAGGSLDRDTTRRAIEIIDRNSRLQAQLIEDLLDISRIITGKLRLEMRVDDGGPGDRRRARVGPLRGRREAHRDRAPSGIA